jgi:DNA-binding NtrC family response regulator
MKKVIVVDDIEDYLDAIEMMLANEYEIFKARSLKEAIEILEREEIDVAIIDIRLDENDPSNRDGLKILKWLKENKPLILPIVMSAYREFDYAVEALNLGAKYFLKKPINPKELKEVIKKYIE